MGIWYLLLPIRACRLSKLSSYLSEPTSAMADTSEPPILPTFLVFLSHARVLLCLEHGACYHRGNIARHLRDSHSIQRKQNKRLVSQLSNLEVKSWTCCARQKFLSQKVVEDQFWEKLEEQRSIIRIFEAPELPFGWATGREIDMQEWRRKQKYYEVTKLEGHRPIVGIESTRLFQHSAEPTLSWFPLWVFCSKNGKYQPYLGARPRGPTLTCV
jgi:hypothetical protein